MAAENKPNNAANNGNKDRKRKRYLPHSKSVKKGSYPLHPGVQGFFITCDGGRERQASHEAINVLDTFYEQLVDDEESDFKHAAMPNKPLNKKIKFSDSDSSSDDEESGQPKEEDSINENQTNEDGEKQLLETTAEQEEDPNHQNQTNEAEESSAKKQCLETVLPKCEGVVNDEPKNKSIDKLIEDELRELKDRSKVRWIKVYD
ncbi:Thump domain-containing protein [Thalictrum thalictroides]|uniref:Thump domain-containing protein n=1 Tax=Thalictrum thalictroides TaxID=46969 RepID=A0A7J6VK02_THATH|nr:Thump domain-containing protein [Thalictrum thalictroides]